MLQVDVSATDGGSQRLVFPAAAGSDPDMPIAPTGNQRMAVICTALYPESLLSGMWLVLFFLYLSARFHPIMLFVFSKASIPLALQHPPPPPHTLFHKVRWN